MLTETLIAIFFLVCLIFFSIVNLHNIIIVHKRRSDTKVYAEAEWPSGLSVSLGAIGTFAYFLEILVYVFLAFTGAYSLLYAPIYCFQLPFAFLMQALGIILTTLGYFISVWSVIARGEHATSWSMPKNHKLVTCGPYHYVRHPSYLGYFLMFLGIFFIWPCIFTLIPIIAILGYYRVAVEEEKLLIKHFGNEYVEYQKKTGRFIPKLLRKQKN